jgi:thiol-disulfide isomerase/thioredoxin
MMLKKTKILNIIVFVVIQAFLVFSVKAQNANATPGVNKATINKLKAEVEAAPGNLARHSDYIKAIRQDEKELEKQYAFWMKKFPKEAAIPFAFGEFYHGGESPNARPYLLKAVELNPKFADAWAALSGDAERLGEFSVAREYQQKAVANAPDNVDYLFFYAMSFASVDDRKYEDLGKEVLRRFPTHQRAAQTLYWLAQRSNTMVDKLKYWEQLYQNYPVDKYSWAVYGVTDYFNALLTENLEKALKLATEMAAGKTNAKEWTASKILAEQVFTAKKMLNDKKGTEALDMLSQIKLSRSNSFNKTLVLLKAEAYDTNGNTLAAYDSLILAFAKTPYPKLKNTIAGYGKKIGKDLTSVEADIWKQFDRIAQSATSFTLKNYFTNGMTSLSDYKGKVVLLTYWFPGCGPCRAEFPHFEKVVRKFKGQDLEYIGINIVSKQNDYVLPFLKGSGYSFTPLEDVKGRVKGTLDNRGMAPINFLIDRDGRVIFSFFKIEENNEDELELMINMLLTGKKI